VIKILVYDREMSVHVNLLTVHPRKLAAVRREVAPGAPPAVADSSGTSRPGPCADR
jgi:hypothetical protein